MSSREPVKSREPINSLEQQIKQLIITSLDLEDITPDDIVTDEPLFNGGLGLDSIDALELGIALQQAYGVSIDAEDEATKQHFYSVKNLAAFVSERGNTVEQGA